MLHGARLLAPPLHRDLARAAIPHVAAPEQPSLLAGDLPLAVPGGLRPAGRPVSFVDDGHAVVEVQARGHRRMVDERAVGDAPATGAHGPHFTARGGPEEVEVVDKHIQDVRVAHRYLKSSGAKSVRASRRQRIPIETSSPR